MLIPLIEYELNNKKIVTYDLKINIGNMSNILKYIFKDRVKNNYIFEMIECLSPSQRGEFEITDAMNLVLENNIKIGNFTCDGYIDAGTISGLLELNTFILNLQQPTTQNSCIVNSPVYVGNQCTIGKNVELGPSVSIGDGVNIGDNVKIKNSLIFNNSKISSNQNISNSIIDDNQNILSLK